MISGYKNLRYLAYGERRYGTQPIFSNRRGFWEFEFILKGKARPNEVNAPIMKDAKPRLYVSHPDSPHGWTDERDGLSEIFVIQFKEVPEELMERVEPTKPLLIHLDTHTLKQLTPRFETIRTSGGRCDALNSLTLHSFLIELTILAVSQSTNLTLRTDPADKVSRALHWFEENLGRSPCVEEAARAVGVSAAHLRRLFAEAGSPSPKSELTRLQIEAAQRGLLEGWTQKGIAEFLGYSEPSTFARAFKEICGQPPGAWLTQNSLGYL